MFTAVHAYSQHHHLELRPDDIWICIISQLSIYVNAHAEELRSMFVSRSGKKELVVRADKTEAGQRWAGVDFGNFAYKVS